MLQKLLISNYAIIDQLEIGFSDKLNIITGETGAGKSIIMGAMGLILGNRADSSVLVYQDKKCIVEGYFAAGKKKAVKNFLQENDLDAGEELVIRREISANGKSRAFINDTPVNLSQLQELSLLLVDLHQQFDSLELGEAGFQRQVLDALAGNADLLISYENIFYQWQTVCSELDALKKKKQQFEQEMDFYQYQFHELDEADLKENELEDLDAELKLLSNAENIKSALSQVCVDLQEGDQPLVQRLKVLAHIIASQAGHHPGLQAISERMHAAQVEIKDIAQELENFNAHVHYDPQRIEWINERISVGYKLLKKHGVQTTRELLQVKAGLEEKLKSVLQADELIAKKESESASLKKKALEVAEKIAVNRKKQVKPLQDQVNKLLARVGMPNAKLKVDVHDVPELNAFGKNSVEFLFDANKSGQYLAVRKVASGGELSRLMLCIKSLVARSVDLPTLIFDEIDTGISGEAARQVGIIMKELAGSRQVISITHQPQIAGKADAHFLVYKEIVDNAVKTHIRWLNTDERITAIAKMLSGEKPTAAAMENAREMVSN